MQCRPQHSNIFVAPLKRGSTRMSFSHHLMEISCSCSLNPKTSSLSHEILGYVWEEKVFLKVFAKLREMNIEDLMKF